MLIRLKLTETRMSGRVWLERDEIEALVPLVSDSTSNAEREEFLIGGQIAAGKIRGGPSMARQERKIPSDITNQIKELIDKLEEVEGRDRTRLGEIELKISDFDEVAWYVAYRTLAE